MKNIIFQILLFSILLGCSKRNDESFSEQSLPEKSLSSWNEGDNKLAIVNFVQKTTTEGSQNYVQEEDRIAVFDNDGTLWSEKPFYFQLAYALDYVKKEAPNHPEWAQDPILKAVLAGDFQKVLSGGEKALMDLVMKSHAGMTEDQFTAEVRTWLQTAKHPETGKAYTEMVYQPMLELLDYLRANGYKTFIVSGGGIDFLRVWAEEAYGIPPYQIIGSSLQAKYAEVEGKMQIVKLPEINFIDDKEGKPVGIHQQLGMKPVIAVGNSDGDFQMLEYTTLQTGPRLGILIHHTDSLREYQYDSLSPIGNLRRGLVEGPAKGWILVDMARDWTEIYPNGNE